MSKRLLVASSVIRTLHLIKEGELDEAWDTAEAVIANFNDLDELARRARPEHADTAERHWVFWREAITLALEDVLHRTEIVLSIDEKELCSAITAYVKQWEPEDLGSLPSKIEFTDPQRGPIFLDARKTLPSFLLQLDQNLTDDTSESALIAFDRAIEASVERICSIEGAYFSEMLSRSDGAVAEGVERRTQWSHHYRWMQDRFWRTPLWGQEETGISLADLYVPLRGYSHLTKEVITDDHQSYSEVNARVFDLQSELESWLRSTQDRDRMRIIGGGPGSGKSSLSKSLGMSVSEWDDWRVVFVEVQGMEETRDLHSQIGERLRRRDNTGFTENPLDWPKDREKTLLILDGLDELSRPGPDAVEVMSDFVQGVKDILSNREGTRAVLLGRTDAAKDALKASRGSLNSLLNVLPLCPVHPGFCRVSSNELISEGSALLEKDQRERYWEKWCMAKGLPTQECRLNDDRFGELSYEPVLAYLLTLSGRLDEGANLNEAAENTNVVYHDVLKRLLPRDWGTAQHPGTEGLKPSDFLFLLSCLGLSAWSEGGRVGKNEDFVRLRDHCAPDSKDFDQEVASLKNVATQFYTKSDGAYEFVHKTFGEYLAARGLLNFVVERLPEFELRHKRKPENILDEWLELAGKTTITAEFGGSHQVIGGILFFLRNEAALLSMEDAIDAKNRLVQLLVQSMRVGFPAHKRQHKNWRDAERSQIYAETTLIACLNAVVRRIGDENKEAARWKINTNDLALLIARNHTAQDETFSISQRCLDYVTLKSTSIMFPVAFGASMIGVEAPNFISFSHTNLVTSLIHEANFADSDFRGANLRSAFISKSDFSNSNFANAFLERIIILETNLGGADFSQAYLYDADLRTAKNLTQNQIDLAFGSEETKLPEGLSLPEHWKGVKTEHGNIIRDEGTII